MARVCTICASDKRLEVDKLITSGKPLREITRQTGFKKDAIQRHKPHVGEAIQKAAETKQVARALTLRERFDNLVESANTSLSEATNDRDKIGWHGVIKGWMDLALKLGMEAQRDKQVNIMDEMPAVMKAIDAEFGKGAADKVARRVYQEWSARKA